VGRAERGRAGSCGRAGRLPRAARGDNANSPRAPAAPPTPARPRQRASIQAAPPRRTPPPLGGAPPSPQALLSYLAASEMGVELAQANAAWMLERGYGHAGPNAGVVAVSLHRRSAEQGNVQSLLLLGDCYYYGAGVEQDLVG
jgi:TPR repeat protein